MQVIRQLNIEDLRNFKDTIIRFIYESNKKAAYMESYNKAHAKEKYEELLSYVDDFKAVVYGAVKDAKLVGFLWAYKYPFRDDKDRLYVSILHVEQEYRSKKIGSSLLAEIEQYAKKENYSSVFLHTEAFNQGAIRFYERCGYDVERLQLVKRELNEEKHCSFQNTAENGGGGGTTP